MSGIVATTYNRSDCKVGIVHLGFGAFHRSHQSVYIDDYLHHSGELHWGIAAVNLRASESSQFKAAAEDIARHDGYFLKTYSPAGDVAIRRVRSHIAFADWSINKADAEDLLALPQVQLVTITVTESGYYTNADGQLNLSDATIQSELNGEPPRTVYAYLREGIARRVAAGGAPVTIACCDNIRQNGKMLKNNLLAYLRSCDRSDLANWVEDNVAFPCSMVDRITPRSPASLSNELSEVVGKKVSSPIMAESFSQWVLQQSSNSDLPDLTQVGVTVTADVDPYEETKIRVLNGGHTALSYLAALEGVETFDAAMRVPHLNAHFQRFETSEVLPAIMLDLPFSKSAYLEEIAQRFSNEAIGDTVARICADGMVKFPIFIRPTLEGCLQQRINPVYTMRSIASWHVFAQHVEAGKISFDYIEPAWDDLKTMLGTEEFLVNRQLWGDLPQQYPEFKQTLLREIAEMESIWPV